MGNPLRTAQDRRLPRIPEPRQRHPCCVQVGGQTGINTLATLGYPPEMRSSGIGWAGASGRIGGIAIPMIGGLVLGGGIPPGVDNKYIVRLCKVQTSTSCL